MTRERAEELFRETRSLRDTLRTEAAAAAKGSDDATDLAAAAAALGTATDACEKTVYRAQIAIEESKIAAATTERDRLTVILGQK